MEGRKKQARSNKQQGKATQHTQDSHFFPCTCKDLIHNYNILIVYSIQSTTNTFQGILISDGSSSYAVFIYDCSNMEWGGGVIGWQQSTTQYGSYYASGQTSSNSAVCGLQTSSFTTFVYRIGEWPSVLSLSSTDCISPSLTLHLSFITSLYLVS